MRHVIFLIAVVTAFFSSAQAVVSCNEVKILYKNYDNLVAFGSDSSFTDVQITVIGGNYKKTTGGYLIKPNDDASELEIRFLKNNNLIYSKVFSCISLPEPELFWGVTPVQYRPALEDKLLVLKSKDVFCIGDVKYRINDWKVTVGNYELSGKGNKLSDEVQMLIFAQRSNKVLVKIHVNYTSTIPLSGTITGQFSVTNPYFENEISFQDVIIIDKDSTNNILFDENNPFSLLRNIISGLDNGYFGYKFIPLTEQQLNRIDPAKKMLQARLLPESDVSLANDDSLSIEFGEDKIGYNDFGLTYQYPERRTIYYDTKDITRLIIFKSEFIDAQTKQLTTTISHIGLAKKYNNQEKFDIVSIIPFDEISSYKEISEIVVENKSPEPYIKLIDDINKNQTKENILADFGYYRRYQFYPFTNLFSDHNSYIPNNVFDSVTYYLDTTFMDYDSLGNLLPSGKYITRIDTIVYNIYVNPSLIKPFFKYSRTDKTSFEPSHITYAIQTPKGFFSYCEVPLKDQPEPLSKIMRGSLNLPYPHYRYSIDDFEWKKELRTVLSGKRSYDLSNKKDIKILEKEFNLDTYKGIPVNILGVCNGCK